MLFISSPEEIGLCQKSLNLKFMYLPERMTKCNLRICIYRASFYHVLANVFIRKNIKQKMSNSDHYIHDE